jgi:uncharacterized phage protein gp47/JayE
MPWNTPSLRQTREMVRDNVTAALYGASFVGNNVLRVMSDTQAGLTHLVLRYVDWLALQLMADSSEVEWLDRHADIWLTNAPPFLPPTVGGTVGRKDATFAAGIAEFTGSGGVAVPAGTQLEANGIVYEVTDLIVLAFDAPTPGRIRAIDPGADGNMDAGQALGLIAVPPGVDGTATVVELRGGTDVESDDDLRIRVLERIRQPPMGGAEHDYIRWAKAVPGVTRAWCNGNEMGMGTVTVRIMCDDLRAGNDGFPFAEDCEAVQAYIDTQRPVTVKDFWVLGPLKQVVDVNVLNLIPDDEATRAAIEDSLQEMIFNLAAPGQTIFATWKAQAVMNTPGVISFDLGNWDDDVMVSPGHMAVLGDIYYGQSPPV